MGKYDCTTYYEQYKGDGCDGGYIGYKAWCTYKGDSLLIKQDEIICEHWEKFPPSRNQRLLALLVGTLFLLPVISTDAYDTCNYSNDDTNCNINGTGILVLALGVTVILFGSLVHAPDLMTRTHHTKRKAMLKCEDKIKAAVDQKIASRQRQLRSGEIPMPPGAPFALPAAALPAAASPSVARDPNENLTRAMQEMDAGMSLEDACRMFGIAMPSAPEHTPAAASGHRT